MIIWEAHDSIMQWNQQRFPGIESSLEDSHSCSYNQGYK